MFLKSVQITFLQPDPHFKYLGGHDCRDPVVTPDRPRSSVEAISSSKPHLHGERTLEALGKRLLTHELVTVFF